MRFTGRLDAFPRLRPWAGLITIALAATVVTPAQAELLTTQAVQLGSATASVTPPLLRRFLIALLPLLAGTASAVRGWDCLSAHRRWRGVSLVLSGLAVATGGLVLLGLNEVPATWHWWL